MYNEQNFSFNEQTVKKNCKKKMQLTREIGGAH